MTDAKRWQQDENVEAAGQNSVDLFRAVAMERFRGDDIRRYLNTGLIASILVHGILVIGMSQRAIPTPVHTMVVEPVFIPHSPPRSKQIVSPSEAAEMPPPESTRLLSDKDTRADEQSIKRGDPLAGVAPGPAGQTASQPTRQQPEADIPPSEVSQPEGKNTPPATREKPAEKKPPAENQDIKPQAGNVPLDLSPRSDYLKDLAQKPPVSSSQSEQSSLQQPPAAARPFARAPGSGARLLGFHGSSDFLPDIQDGDITLLNAKADKYAVFVRRVAIRVFHLLKQYGWDYMRAGDFQSLNRFTHVIARLDSNGNFIGVTLEDSSGNRTFDDLVQRSIKDGASDPNPPPSALTSAGEYEFIFLARSWSQSGGSRMTQHRWLSLQTGLQ